MLNLWIQRDDCMSKGNEDSISKIYLHSHNHHNTIHNSQDVETSQGPMNAWTDKEVMIIWTVVAYSRLCPTLCDPMDCSTPGFPVLHHLPKFAQIHVHWVGDAIQPPHPLSSPSPSISPSIRYAHTYKETLFNHENEGNPVTCDNMDGPWGQYAK